MSEDPFKRDEKGRLLPGHKGGPGRPKGQSLKEYWKQRFANMSDEEKLEFTKSVSPEIIWRMSEGNPTSDDKVQQTVKVIIMSEPDEINPSSSDNPEG